MRDIELETWVVGVLDRAKAGQPNEDFRIEFKAEWPKDIHKAARRLAGHANAAQGDRVLWVIGVEDNGVVVGAKQEDRATWWPKILARFDEVTPTMLRDMNIPYDGHTVVALLFETDRAPFVVKAEQQQGPIQREIPWREATEVRTARRQDLIRLLAPLVRLPEVELMEVSLTAMKSEWRMTEEWWSFKLVLFITPHREPVHFPLHKYRARAQVRGTDRVLVLEERVILDNETLQPDEEGEEPSLHRSVTVDRPRALSVWSGVHLDPNQIGGSVDFDLTVELGIAGASRPVRIAMPLFPSGGSWGNVRQGWFRKLS